MDFQYFIPTKILFGTGKLNELSKIKLPGTRALIVISNGTSMKKYGYLDKVQNLLKENGVDSLVFNKVSQNPTLSNVMDGAAIAKREDCDFVVGLGGGSSIDAAKSIALMSTNTGNYWDYVSGGTGGGRAVPNKPLPIIAITTTAGTGSEADPWTVITKEDTNEKIGFGTEDTFPLVSIVDPELMTTVPPILTAYQGFDALFHATEGYIANISTPLSDILALKSIELIAKNLPKAVKNGNDIEARTNVALANTLSGMVESTSSCTSEHSMEHALSAYYPKLPHGAGLIMLCESYYSFFEDKIPEKLIEMAKAMGESGIEGPPSFIIALRKLMNSCNVNNLKMSEYGIREIEIPKIAENARNTMGGLFALDRYTLSLDETIEIIQNAYK